MKNELGPLPTTKVLSSAGAPIGDPPVAIAKVRELTPSQARKLAVIRLRPHRS